MKRFSIAILLLLALTVTPPPAHGLELSPMFTDHAVLQQGVEVPVWGWAKPDSEVTVAFAGQTVKAKADKQGTWSLKLKALKVDKKPQKMAITGDGATVTLSGILVGEVWFCSGQSNMEQTVTREGIGYGGSIMPEHVKPDELGLIRHIKFPHKTAKQPTKKTAVQMPWTVCSSKTVGKFTAAGFYFACVINKELGVPVGLIGCNWGGCRIEPWIPQEGYDVMKGFDKNWQPRGYSAMFNGMGATAAPYAIRGAIWYQGESNGGEGETYFQKKKALHEGWKKVWGQGDFPLYFAQLASFKAPNANPAGGDGWAKVREAQRKCLTLPNTGMAVLTDIGDPRNIHPHNKYDVGRRLALWALAKDYGKKDLVYSGPLFKSAEFKDGKATISFEHCKGLKAAMKERGKKNIEDPKPVDAVKGFAIAGADKKWVWADAKIEGDKVVLTSKEVKEPVAARYLFTMNTDHGTLYNGANLPAAPFRTDDW